MSIHAFTAALALIEAGVNMVVGAVFAGAILWRTSGGIIHVFTNDRTVWTELQTLDRGSANAIICEISGRIRQPRDLCMSLSQSYP